MTVVKRGRATYKASSRTWLHPSGVGFASVDSNPCLPRFLGEAGSQGQIASILAPLTQASERSTEL